jgi:hypothetical protein
MKKYKNIFQVIFFVIYCSLNSQANSQDTHGLFSAFNRFTSGSQAAVGTSLLSSGSATVLFLNPAGMQFLERSQIAFTYLRLKPDLDQKHMSYAITYRFGDEFSLGLGGISYLVDNIEGYNQDAQYTGSIDLNESLFALSMASSILSPFQVGLNVKTAKQTISTTEPVNDRTYAFDYGFVYRQYDWFLVSVSTQSAFMMNDGERSLPRLRSSVELDLPFFHKSKGAALQLSMNTQTEFGHWTTGVIGTHLRYPFSEAMAGYINVRTPSVLILENEPIDTDLGYQTLERWGVCGGIKILMRNDFILKLEMTYLNEKYFDQQISTLEIIGL